MLRHWIPIEKLDLKMLLIYNRNPMVIPFLENGWYIKEKCELDDKSDGGDKRKKMTIASVIELVHDWSRLFSNPNAMSLLQQNLYKVDWKQLPRNPNIFEDEDIACE